VLGAVRVAGINEQMSKTLGEGGAFWANRIKESANVRKQMTEAKSEHAQEKTPPEETKHDFGDEHQHRRKFSAERDEEGSAVEREITRRHHRGGKPSEEMIGV